VNVFKPLSEPCPELSNGFNRYVASLDDREFSTFSSSGFDVAMELQYPSAERMAETAISLASSQR
jgi:hypothetical protein